MMNRIPVRSGAKVDGRIDLAKRSARPERKELHPSTHANNGHAQEERRFEMRVLPVIPFVVESKVAGGCRKPWGLRCGTTCQQQDVESRGRPPS